MIGKADWLRVLVRNLVDNAVRYTPAGAGAGQTRRGRRRRAPDRGRQRPGHRAEERERVLDRFHRLAGGDVAGSGLGLSIVARIVELHAARLALERDSTLGAGRDGCFHG